jgi:hypothetical protein
MLFLSGTNDVVITTFHTVTSAWQLTRFCVSAWICCAQPVSRSKQVVVERVLSLPSVWGEQVCLNSQMGILPNGKPYARYTDRAAITHVASSVTPISSNEWTFIAGIYDGTNLQCYVNGELKRAVLSPVIPATGYDVQPEHARPARILIGANDNDPNGSTNNLDSYFTGLIDEVQVWNDCVAQEQIQTNMYRKPFGIETNFCRGFRSVL